MNKLYFGDCLDILKQLSQSTEDGLIDLIYIDPPFNSKRNYNVLFEDAVKPGTKAQKQAFADTWSNISYKDELDELYDLDLYLYNFLKSLDKLPIVSQSTVAYLTTMALRIFYMKKILKETGSFYLHCDPTMSHYLKIVCDLIFGNANFKSEIVWQRTTNLGSSKSLAKRFSNDTDSILFYTKSKKYYFKKIFKPYSAEYLKRFKYEDEKGKYRWSPMKTYSEEKMNELKEKDEVRFTKAANPEYKQYFHKLKGIPMSSLWSDIFHINPMAKEHLGYPTQKPEALLERIIEASSKKGDVVADFFCGCGTTIAVGQRLGRKWLGVDISHLAVGLIRKRLIDSYGTSIIKTFEVNGLPKDLASAQELAVGTKKGRIKFQDWVIETMLEGVSNPKKTADGGWDGYLTFRLGKQKELVLIEVKSGKLTIKNMREFIQVVDNQEAAMGLFVCFEGSLTKGMQAAARDAGYYNTDLFGKRYLKIQIITIESLLAGNMADVPVSSITTFKSAERKEVGGNGTKHLDL